MKVRAERSIERLSLHFWRNGKLVTHTGNRGLAVMAWSLEHKRNARRRDLCELYMKIGGSKDLCEIDRRMLGEYVRKAMRSLCMSERQLLAPRYVKLGYALWSRGYGISSYSKFLRSVNHFSYCLRLSSLGLKEINDMIRRIRNEPLKHNERGQIERYTFGRYYGR